MIDWKKSMKRTFEFYEVDSKTWKDKRKLSNITECSIKWDLDAETLGSATIKSSESLGESYIRTYMIAIQNGLTYRIPLGTFLVQTTTSSFDGKSKTVPMDAYTPLLELKDNYPPLGYTVIKDQKILETGARICDDHMRAPIIVSENDETLFADFTANTDETWLAYLKALIANAKYHLDINEMGEILFAPDQETASLQPIYTYDDSNSSILYPDVEDEHDLYGIPNVVEVVYSKDSTYKYARAVNDNPDSITSTVSRGREILHRVTDPNIGDPTQEQLEQYAKQVLREKSSVEHTITYSHGWTPVRVGNCVRLDYARAGMRNIKAKVISQSFNCDAGCKVSETAVYTIDLWR